MENHPAVISVVVLVHFVKSLFFCSMPAVLVGLRQFCAKSMFFLFTQINFAAQTGPHNKGSVRGEGGAISVPANCCRSCQRPLSPADRRERAIKEARRAAPAALTAADIELVIARLGMRVEEEYETQQDGKCRDCFLLEAAGGVLEEKDASTEELAAAFSVFDADGDGYIGPEELQGVLWRLGLEEAREIEDCRRMIGAFDEDGDGRIGLAEFKHLLERAT